MSSDLPLPAFDIAVLRADLLKVAIPEKAPGMARYTRDQFPYLGINTPSRHEVLKPWRKAARAAGIAPRLAFISTCWHQPEREFQYAAIDLLKHCAKQLRACDLPLIKSFVVDRSWWETIDPLATRVIGPLVVRHPELVADMDDWIDSENIWLARCAILHQLMVKQEMNEERLFRYCKRRAGEEEFFIRKAIGWALRQHARRAPEAVQQFVAEHADILSPLAKREALKHF